MTKSELIESLASQCMNISHKDIDKSVRVLFDYMADSLIKGQRIEIRGFGGFSLRHRPPRLGRNPKTGDVVPVEAKSVVHFKMGKELRERVNAT